MSSDYLKYYKGFFTPFFEIVKTYFKSFSIEQTKQGKPIFKSVITAAFVKCFEFNYLNSRASNYKESFFLMGTLRSICEDLISLGYLKKLPAKERNELLSFTLKFDIAKNLIVQETFFQKYNPGQLIVNPLKFAEADYLKFVSAKPVDKKQAKQKGYKLYPSVFKMAEESNYQDFYKFLYHATSSEVRNPSFFESSCMGSTISYLGRSFRR